MVATGADGAPGGWACAHLYDDGGTTLEVRALAAVPRGPAVGLDVPIGLPATQRPRPCDEQARDQLGPALRATVFTPPCRPVLDAPTYAEARTRLAAIGGASISAQAFALAPRIRVVDAVARAEPGHETWLLECHPELAFRRLSGGGDAPPLPSKRTAAGLVRRLALVRERFPDAEERLAGAPAGAALDDWLDAYACLATAARAPHEREVLGGQRDDEGICMRMVV